MRTEFCDVENSSGSRLFQKVKNPISTEMLTQYINKLAPDLHHSISLTGGEPLLQNKFLLSFLPKLKNEFSIPIYLESGGHRPGELKNIVDFIDYVSMDFKLPSSAKTGSFWDEHRDFLNISLAAKKNIWVKIVVSSDTFYDDLLSSINLVRSLSTGVEIFLQPVTEINSSKPPDEISLLDLHSKLLQLYPHIRVIPQVHKLIGQR